MPLTDNSFASVKKEFHQKLSKKGKYAKADVKAALAQLETRSLPVQLDDAKKILQRTFKPYSKDQQHVADEAFRQNALAFYIKTMRYAGLCAKRYGQADAGYQDYHALTPAQALCMNVRTHVVFTSEADLNAYLNEMTGGSFKAAVESKTIYPRASTHTLKPGKGGERPTEGKSVWAGAKAGVKNIFTEPDLHRPTGNFGLDLSIGGRGKKNLLNKDIVPDGTNGTMLINITRDPASDLYAVSLSLEDSAPRKKNQFNIAHSYVGAASKVSALVMTKKAPKDLKGFDKVLARVKKPFQNPSKEQAKKNEAILEEWDDLGIIPPEKRSGFLVGPADGDYRLDSGDIKNISQQAFTIEDLTLPLSGPEDSREAIEHDAEQTFVRTEQLELQSTSEQQLSDADLEVDAINRNSGITVPPPQKLTAKSNAKHRQIDPIDIKSDVRLEVKSLRKFLLHELEHQMKTQLSTVKHTKADDGSEKIIAIGKKTAPVAIKMAVSGETHIHPGNLPISLKIAKLVIDGYVEAGKTSIEITCKNPSYVQQLRDYAISKNLAIIDSPTPRTAI